MKKKKRSIEEMDNRIAEIEAQLHTLYIKKEMLFLASNTPITDRINFPVMEKK